MFMRGRAMSSGRLGAPVWEEAVEALDEVERLGRCETRDTGKQNLGRISGKKTEAVVRLGSATFGTRNFDYARVAWMRPRKGCISPSVTEEAAPVLQRLRMTCWM